jgi:hypothetical protein
MPKIVTGLAPGELPDAPRIYSKAELKKILRWGEGKYQANRHLIEHVRIGGRDAFTPEAIARFIKASTIKPGERAKPRERQPRRQARKVRPRRPARAIERAAGVP